MGVALKYHQVRTGGLWSIEEQKLHINCLELTAVLLAVKSFAKERMDINILIRTDNISARAYINHFPLPSHECGGDRDNYGNGNGT